MNQQKPLREVSDEQLEAVVETMYLAANADDEFTPDEYEHFATSVEVLTDGRFAGDKLETLLSRSAAKARTTALADSLASVKTRLGDPVTCRLAVEVAVQMLAADGIIRTSEREFLMELADALGIDRNDAADIVKDVAR